MSVCMAKKLAKFPVAPPIFHCLDDKNRMRLPQEYHELFEGETYYVVKGQGDWLDVLSYEQVTAKLNKLRKSKRTIELNKAINNFRSQGVVVNGDGQNRFVLSQGLRDYAKITKKIVISIGIDCIQIFSDIVWEEEILKADMSALDQTYVDDEDDNPEEQDSE